MDLPKQLVVGGRLHNLPLSWEDYVPPQNIIKRDENGRSNNPILDPRAIQRL